MLNARRRTGVQVETTLQYSVIIFLHRTLIVKKCILVKINYYLSIGAILLKCKTEAVQNTSLGSDTLGVVRLVPHPGQGCGAVVADHGGVTVWCLRCPRRPRQSLQLQDHGGRQPDVPVSACRQLLDVRQAVHEDVGVRNNSFWSKFVE